MTCPSPGTRPVVPAGRALYGRAAELDALRNALSSAIRGQGSLVLVAGEAGIGKTSLVDAICAEARDAGAVTISGGCYDLTTTPPFGPWVELFQRARGPFPNMPSLQTLASETGSEQGRDGLFELVLHSLSDAAKERPLVLVLEDQHWSDRASLDLTRFLARHLNGMAILAIVTYRDAELGRDRPLYHTLPRLVRDARPLRLWLRRLDDDALRALVTSRYTLAERDERRLVAYLIQYSEGNPFFAEELLRALEHDRLLSATPDGWCLAEIDDIPVPPLVRQLIDGRAAWIDAEARQMLQVAAVIGADFPLDLWQSVLEASDDDLSDAIEQAQSAHLVTESTTAGGFRFQHALIRQALYESLVLPHRQRWHRRVAEALARGPDPDPDTVAHHFQQAGDDRAARWLIDAGARAARMYATRIAVERYERAWQLLENGLDAQVDRGLLLCDLAEAHRYTDAEKALRYLDVARHVVDRSGDDALATVVLWCRARIRGFIGEDALDEGRQAMAALDRLPPARRDEILSHGRQVISPGSISNWFAHFGRYDEAIATAQRVLSGMSPADETMPAHATEAGNAIYALALSYAGLGMPEESRQAFRRSGRCLRAANNHFMVAALLKWELVEVNLAYATDDTAERSRLVQEYTEAWHRTSSFAIDVDGRSILPMFQLDMLQGAWDRAYEAALLHLGVSALRVDALATLAEIDWRRGRRPRAWEHVRAALPGGAATPPSNLYFIRTLSVLRIAARLAMDDGQFDRAREWMDAHERWLTWSGRVLDRAAGPLLWAHYHRMRGDRERAHAHSLDSLRLSSEPRQPLAMLRALRLLGELDIESGRLADAESHLKRALSLADACALPHERALVVLAQAQLELARGNRHGVAEMLGHVRQVCESVGAAPVLAHVERLEASRHGASRASRHPSGLSPREIDVLRLVARGMTDSEVAGELRISSRTVSGHLQSIFNKLGISSRTAAAVKAIEHGIAEPGGE